LAKFLTQKNYTALLRKGKDYTTSCKRFEQHFFEERPYLKLAEKGFLGFHRLFVNSYFERTA